jgi:hypothetical protein
VKYNLVGYLDDVKLDNTKLGVLDWAHLTNFKSKLRLNLASF